MDFLITWTIDAEGKDSAVEAAQWARDLQLKPDAMVGYFTLRDKKTGLIYQVDLDEGKPDS